MQQYFIKGPCQNPIFIKDKETVKHMFQVMRLTDGDQVCLVFDDGIKRLAAVSDSAAHSFTILEDWDQSVELPVDVTIASGFPKGDKLEWVTQKATELGASAIWAFPADWSVAKWDGKKLAKKQEKLAKIAQGAAEQSKRNIVPEVELFEQKADFLKEVSGFDNVFVAYEESAKTGEQAAFATGLKDCQPGDKLLFIFGPEGGLSPQEIQAFEVMGAQTIGLGPRIMRTETAPLYVLSAVSYALELDENNKHDVRRADQ
ncbi:16S rRNA (uracil(1498)-N(3))-methyltransferase [Streptococcus pseudoporcinus]|uniref:Ribosomal RNA small subunit methyltransferase E n=1 Tax=Streptococcus pseudoporcinus TaxID=361101 RepID=A0A4U9XH50_9STRE|nr:16S rRNA (uracil(1498)-N(3))-methyltransferase [Streptococcus pseudoporcinus]VTS12474.1 ribosomal RNA small subunit methyltransferase E [Streptococcus pseudoporcinus]VUC65010.1 ribosomal RNA small subunit methyltransferase E [Streptococcus pseudoporcinus]VUC95703.1 ribosomal RNA small subunit methyltransferase E [Streptococcus pseudoporcinus]VUC96097.1 ribosomal RNA small subunit methyltransferase E [Streptococcus pseudoporcinus]